MQGIGNLPEPVKTEIITWAKNNREKILQELDPNAKNVFTEKETENKVTPPTAKSAKRPFDSFYSTPGRRFSGNKDREVKPDIPEARPEKEKQTELQIEPMKNCLHGQFCSGLDASGEKRPICKQVGMPVFDLKHCPIGRWFKENSPG
ncbi:MAG: hypothetical protein K9J85_05325 [Desulfobacteraceae bacterium]|nr:hypothetical protein [Desulfobacteraceae bacterium]